MTIGLILTVVFACLHWIDGASYAVSQWPTVFIFLPIIIESSIEIFIMGLGIFIAITSDDY